MKRKILNVMAVAIMAAAFTACGSGSGGGNGSSGGGKSSAKIKMTTEESRVQFYLAGSGVATVDWGDGSEKVSLTLNETDNIPPSSDMVHFRHTYPTASIRTITINGDNITKYYQYSGGITSLDVSRATELTSLGMSNFHGSENTLTSLDVSKNTALTSLDVNGYFTSLDVRKNTALTSLLVNGNLTSLDVSKNTELTVLFVWNNQLTAAALNALFGTLHSNTVPSIQGYEKAKMLNIYGNPGASDCDRSIAESKGWTFR